MCAEMGVLGDKRGTWGHCGIGGGRGHCRVAGKPGDKWTWRQQRTAKDRGERQENGVGMLQGERRDNLVTLGAWGEGQQGWHQHAVRGHGDLSDETGVRGHMRGRDGAVGVLGGGEQRRRTHADAGVPLGLGLPHAGITLHLRRAALPQRVQVILGTGDTGTGSLPRSTLRHPCHPVPVSPW